MLLKVFIVDDEPVICEMIATLIDWESYGFQIAGMAYNGQDAWHAIREAKDIALLVTDIQMSPVNGLELMRKLHQEEMRARVIVLSAYDDFHYLKEAMALGIDNYLLKPLNKEELETILEQIVSSMEQQYVLERQDAERNNFMRTNVLNQIMANNYSIRDVKEKCELLDIRLHEAPFQVVMIDTITAQSERAILKERHLCQYALLNIAAEIMENRGSVHLFGGLSGEVLLLLTKTDNQWSHNQINELIHHIVHQVEQSLHIQLLAIIGKPGRSWRLIYQSYDSARELLDYKYIVEQTTVLDYSYDNAELKLKLIGRQLGLDRISHAIMSGEMYQIRGLMEEMERRMMKASDSQQLHLWRSALVDWIRRCPEFLQSAELNVIDVQYRFSETIQQLLLVDSIPLLWNKFALAVDVFIEMIENINLNKSDNIVNDIKSYIDANYADNLTLKYLAVHFHLSPSYLGKRFREEVGESFNDYVNRIRIHKSQQLLVTTREHANDIAASIGYSDPNYFYRLFKKHVGCSPTEYRRMKV
ncbi:response regulator [Paenibacillus sp. PAMC21692]|uniref:response regulator n=1 Tax=Paenibacillus sp. PAMC21692 TaxID=2762320 RepID=UPI00164DB5B2|nr:response regulator [Paenibacillus sp. PAMC21692]QNK55923.1 response regulator [Paenibacillus sp. PAMC21692]